MEGFNGSIGFRFDFSEAIHVLSRGLNRNSFEALIETFYPNETFKFPLQNRPGKLNTNPSDNPPSRDSPIRLNFLFSFASILMCFDSNSLRQRNLVPVISDRRGEL